ncbi:MAG: orotate phosphoribosyltransferase [Firmicutes bacterium GWF2_51_9]|nr:MAG: orotate phosphoribosyltransferase [Firmicutes bacterium GWF2_51_9]OGS57330.1 MAG: orotate phosphoribosyltransferase [Firmicutes bacterium GWE2_51_13]HAM62536.1 orotate phosphoribosyltransferase [Erysipelotrichaceae bacterium]HBZ41441.1 orotate phosphoribosyltransferase [Erysipelotrichaceae bacterium]
MNTAQRIAEHLLKVEAVSLRPDHPFTWASGILSPIYCDNRITLSYPSVRRDIANELAKTILEHYPDVEVIAGTATAGIPQACWVAEILNLPMVYIRTKAKDHGKENQIEGRITAGQKMVVIEDLISTGGSVLDACEAARREGADVLGVAAIFTYQLPKGIANFEAHGLKLVTLSDYTTLLQVAQDQGYIQKEHLDVLMEWKKDPQNWKR